MPKIGPRSGWLALRFGLSLSTHFSLLIVSFLCVIGHGVCPRDDGTDVAFAQRIPWRHRAVLALN
jgi:hypothetical protein